MAHTARVHTCQAVATQRWCKFAAEPAQSPPQLHELGGEDMHMHSPSPARSPQLSACQRHATCVSPAAFQLSRCQKWSGSCRCLHAACTLPDVAGWQPLSLLLWGQWVKSCNCLQRGGIQDTSPVLVCKHIYLSAVVSSVIKRGKMESDKISEEE